MKPEEIKVWDWARMFIGEVPGTFFIEVLIRTFFIFLLLIIAMRLLGRRMAAQLSRNELLAMVTLAAAIGVPVQSPDRGLIPSLLIAGIVILIGRLIAGLAVKSQKFEMISQDNVDVLVDNSAMCLGVMKRARISTDRLCAQLRSEGIKHLGEVKRLYIEANGCFSLLKEKKPFPGLSILPNWDEEFKSELQVTNTKVCGTCGKRKEEVNTNSNVCDNCGSEKWVTAVI